MGVLSLDYYGPMPIQRPLLMLLASTWCFCANAQAPAAPSPEAPPKPLRNSALNSEILYQVLLGEITARNGEPGAAYTLMLDAARKTNEPDLYQRTVEIALQSRSGEPALQAARAWKLAHPSSRDANRYVLQLLIALNRLAETTDPLKADIQLASNDQKAAALASVPRLYARATDRKLVASIVEQALAEFLSATATGAPAWTTVGRLRLAAADPAGALEAARRGQTMDPAAEGPAVVALELMDPKRPGAEELVKVHLSRNPRPDFLLGYARVLVDFQRNAEATRQLERLTTDHPTLAEAWLLLGTLQSQDVQTTGAESSLKRYLELAAALPRQERERGLTEAYLGLSRIAEKKKDYPLAQAWLDRIENAQDLVAARTQRASILARQGRLEEGRQLIRSIPDKTPGSARMKLMAEVQLLRENKRYQAAYDLLNEAAARSPGDSEYLYDLAMLAEKIGSLGEMERLLRQLIAAKPDYHHAYNALGYSLADRNVRLPEARQLVLKALEFAPDDPFIRDSLGWVEFRMGNQAEAQRILEEAYKARPDAEIAAHLGEVLWVAGRRERARAIWKEGLLLNPENETLTETLKRLRVSL